MEALVASKLIEEASVASAKKNEEVTLAADKWQKKLQQILQRRMLFLQANWQKKLPKRLEKRDF